MNIDGKNEHVQWNLQIYFIIFRKVKKIKKDFDKVVGYKSESN